MKKSILIILAVALPLLGCPKDPINGEYTQKVRGVKIPEADANFYNLMMGVAMEIDRCAQEPVHCEGLEDSMKPGNTSTVQMQIKWVRHNEKSGKIQLAMAQLEDAMIAKKGGEILTYENVFSTFAYYPGYSVENIKKRLSKYIDLLKSTEE